MAFSISKDLKPEKITGFTFQGMPITLSKLRGRPKKTGAIRNKDWVPMEKKLHAACIYAVTGSLKEASRLSDIPQTKLKMYKGEQWWIDTIKQVHKEDNDRISAKMSQVVEAGVDAILDRITNGDIVNQKVKNEDGTTSFEQARVPVKLKDLSMPVALLTDKRNLLRGEATSRAVSLSQEETLKNLADKFESFAKKLQIKEPEVIDVVPEQIIEVQSEEIPDAVDVNRE